MRTEGSEILTLTGHVEKKSDRRKKRVTYLTRLENWWKKQSKEKNMKKMKKKKHGKKTKKKETKKTRNKGKKKHTKKK